ncbi:MAG: flippase-like domain-containing protein [Synergistaceae bacterium]|nr:flippase-like domain-containing protein [Synergistaceae bacterium]MBQ9574823.1 flippase-like domain-containing protein [Synergistaceae bacterium]
MSLRRGLIIFILLAFGVSALIIFRSVDEGTVRSLLAADKLKLLLALFIVFAAWVCDSGRFCALSYAAHENVSFRLGIVLTWLNYFGSAVTPMQSGGGPFQVYALYKRGVPVGKGIAITLMRTMLTVLILSLAVPIALMLDPEILAGSPFLKGLVFYVFIVILATWAFIAFTVIKPETIKKLSHIIVLWLRRFNFMHSNRTVIKIVRWLDREIDNYILNFRLAFNTGKLWVLIAVILSVLHLLSLFSVLPVLMSAVGLPFRYSQTIAVQAVFMFILYFVPTPGASGVAEGGGALLYSILMPENMAGIMSIICRFFTDYISIFMGVVVVIRMLGWGVTENLHRGASVEDA